MKRLAFATLVLYFACIGIAAAQCTADLSWTPPSAYENGDSLDPATDLSGYGIYVDGARYATATDGSVTSYSITDLPADGVTHDFQVTAIAAASGVESVMSNTASNTCTDQRRPNPPSLIDVLIAWLKGVWSWMFA